MSTAEKFIELQEELKKYRPIMSRASEELMNSEVTKYPIFVVHRQVLELGVPLVLQDGTRNPWSIHVSSLEEFHVKGLVQKDKTKDFIKVYKDPQDYFCVFVLSELGAQFIFLPTA